MKRHLRAVDSLFNSNDDFLLPCKIQNTSGDSSEFSRDSGISSEAPITEPVEHRRKRRQDWCRWPVCQQYRYYGQCAKYNETLGPHELQACQLAHVNAIESNVPITSDGFVRVCFDSMGLVQVGFGTINHPLII
ncbi:Sphingosine-1-phosphate lyase 1 [Cichlidogyrus casuarinus]|uniref:Sphingosine-1-phosphate lyase 1 n=1 Tax=Cichlidogyrus casuarinus TaxID=1844966 RepID=A0ABD2QIW0_9PLAT